MTLRYLALGDSYTIGESVPVPARWPEGLAQRLRRAGLPLAPPRIVATTGWKIGDLAAALDRAALEPRWDLVSLLIGVNDQYEGLDEPSLRAAYDAILARAVALARGRPERVFAVSIPDWSQTPFCVREGRDPRRMAWEIDACNSAERAIAARRGVCWLDVTGLSRRREAGWIAADGLHPSGLQYQAWVDRLVGPVFDLAATAGHG